MAIRTPITILSDAVAIANFAGSAVNASTHSAPANTPTATISAAIALTSVSMCLPITIMTVIKAITDDKAPTAFHNSVAGINDNAVKATANMPTHKANPIIVFQLAIESLEALSIVFSININALTARTPCKAFSHWSSPNAITLSVSISIAPDNTNIAVADAKIDDGLAFLDIVIIIANSTLIIAPIAITATVPCRISSGLKSLSTLTILAMTLRATPIITKPAAPAIACGPAFLAAPNTVQSATIKTAMKAKFSILISLRSSSM